jgi:hypothetical protein
MIKYNQNNQQLQQFRFRRVNFYHLTTEKIKKKNVVLHGFCARAHVWLLNRVEPDKRHPRCSCQDSTSPHAHRRRRLFL